MEQNKLNSLMVAVVSARSTVVASEKTLNDAAVKLQAANKANAESAKQLKMQHSQSIRGVHSAHAKADADVKTARKTLLSAQSDLYSYIVSTEGGTPAPALTTAPAVTPAAAVSPAVGIEATAPETEETAA